MDKQIIEGLAKFRDQVYATKQDLFQRLASGQSPSALLITCSDSRIDPCLFTQTEPGDLFVIRNAGNLVPPYGEPDGGVAASVEYAVRVLQVKDIIICGHSQCGAVTGMLDPDSLQSLPAVASWVRYAEGARQLMPAYQSNGNGQLDAAIRANVVAQLNQLKTHPSVAEALEKNALQLHGWVYVFESGEVLSLNSEGEFVAVI